MSNTFYTPKAQYNFTLSSRSHDINGDFLSASFPTIQLPTTFPKDQLFELTFTDYAFFSISNTALMMVAQFGIEESDLHEYNNGSPTSVPYITFSCTEDKLSNDRRNDMIGGSSFLFYLDGTNKLTFRTRYVDTSDNKQITWSVLDFNWTISFTIKPIYK